MSSRLPNPETYWAQLSGASNLTSQTLEGVGTGAKLDAPKAQVATYSQRSGSTFKPDV